MKKIMTFSVFVLAFLIVFAGCAKKDDYALKVNNEAISRQNYDEKLKAMKSSYEKQGVDFTTEQGKSTLTSIQEEVLENLISGVLIKQEIEKNKWDLRDAEIAKQIENIKTQLKNQGTDYQVWLTQKALTEEELVQIFAFQNNVGKDVTVTDIEVKQFFSSNYSQYGGQDEQVKARHILLETEKEAEEVIKELKAGADFAELAKKKSIEPAAATSGGDLGYFSRGQMVTEFEEAAYNQNVGEISAKPVKTSFGYHVILVEDHRQAVIPDYEKVKESVKKDALAYAKNQKVQSYYSQLRKDAKIEYAEDLKVFAK